MTKIMVIPDTQCKPGQDFKYLEWFGKYAVEKLPDYIIHLGDHWDMQSLSSYDVGKKSFEGRSYLKDIEAGNAGMDALMSPIVKEITRRQVGKKKRWNPKLLFINGNHERRLEIAVELDRKLEGLMTYDHFNLSKYGWEFNDFLEVRVVEGVAFSHYFVSGVMGRPVSSARTLATKKHMSCVMGHVQQTEIDMSQRRGDGTPIIGLFAGVSSPYDEGYLNAQSNKIHRQIWILHEVHDGFFYPMQVSLNFLRERYGSKDDYSFMRKHG